MCKKYIHIYIYIINIVSYLYRQQLLAGFEHVQHDHVAEGSSSGREGRRCRRGLDGHGRHARPQVQHAVYELGAGGGGGRGACAWWVSRA